MAESKIILPAEKKKEPNYKSTVAIVLKNGVQVSSKSICIPEFLWKGYDAARSAAQELNAYTMAIFPLFEVEVGDDAKNVMRVDVREIVLISIMEYVDEEKAARRSGLVVPNRSAGGIPRVQ